MQIHSSGNLQAKPRRSLGLFIRGLIDLLGFGRFKQALLTLLLLFSLLLVASLFSLLTSHAPTIAILRFLSGIITATANVLGTSDSADQRLAHPHTDEFRNFMDAEGLATLEYRIPRNVAPGHISLQYATPQECESWRTAASDTSVLDLSRHHFLSRDGIDWFIFVALFNERFHDKSVAAGQRPRYIDVGSTYAKFWSNTWFFDRCMGWDGICIEALPGFHDHLTVERHCHLIPKCVSDKPKTVDFAFADAWSGVVKEDSQDYGVDMEIFSGKRMGSRLKETREITCTTLRAELERFEMKHFDFMNLNVAGHEYPVLLGIDWASTIIDVIVTRSRSREVKQLLEEKGYLLYKDVIKDFIYVRNESGLSISEKHIQLGKSLNRKFLQFPSRK